jgi:hypothetical protein
MDTLNYLKWYIQQPPEQQSASDRLMRLCRLLGEASRRYPFSARAKKLNQAVRDHYEKWGDGRV